MEDPLKTEAFPLTPDTVTEAVKEVDLSRLCWCLCVPASKRDEIKVQYLPNAHRRVLVDWWFSTNPAPSWRRLIHGLDLYNQGRDPLCRKTADKIRSNAEPIQDPTFTLQNVTTAVESVENWNSLGYHLGVPSRKRGNWKEMLQYFIATVPNSSWQTLAGGLYHREEHAALERVTKHFQPRPEATLTVANLCSELEEVVEWDSLGYCLDVPGSIRSEIKEKHSNVSQRKQAMLAEWLNHHPAPSWILVANALYGRLIGGKYHKVLQLVKQKYLNAAVPLLEQSVTHPSSSGSPRKVSAAGPLPEQQTDGHPTPSGSPRKDSTAGPHRERSVTHSTPSGSPRKESAAGPLRERSVTHSTPSGSHRKESAAGPLPEQSVSSTDTHPVLSGSPRKDSATLQSEPVSSTAQSTPPASLTAAVDAATLQSKPVSSTAQSTPPASLTAAVDAASTLQREPGSPSPPSTPPTSITAAGMDAATLQREPVSPTPPSTPPSSVTAGADAATLQREPVSSTPPSTPPSSVTAGADAAAVPTPRREAVIVISPPSPQSSLDSTVVTPESSLSKLSLGDIEYSDLEFMEKVGRGGFGTVSKGRWISENKTVAIKMLTDLDEREVRILSSLDHPSIIHYYGTATQNDVHYIVTEFAENGSIYDYIHKEHKQPPLSQILLWAVQVAEGMVYLHQQDIIHRDLKSSNVVLTSTQKAKICDLGSARSLEHTACQTTAVGTYAWMAPEMLRREKVSKSCDVYSYSVLLFEMATQQQPFPDVLPILVPSMIVEGKRPTIPEKCDPRLADLIKSCWEQDPKARPSFQEILKALSGDRSSLKKFGLADIEFSDLEFMEKLGSGGFGTVSKGRWISENKIVAIKMMMVLEEREVRILSSLDHPSIIRYYGRATQNNVHYIVTEFAENGSIYDHIYRDHKQPPLSQILLWAAQVAEGMVYLHQQDIIHRDLKSSNVVLTSTLEAKICDLGSARRLQHSTRQVTAVGTYAWMAPEMLRGEKVSKSCDVYSYGVLVFEMATQQLPFPDVLPIMVPGMVAAGERPTIPETCDPYLVDLIKRCWEQEAKVRPSFKEILITLRTDTNRTAK